MLQGKFILLIRLILSYVRVSEIKQSKKKLVIFIAILLLLTMKFVLMFIEVFRERNIHHLLKFFQCLPVIILILITFVDYTMKSDRIVIFLNEIDELINKANNEEMKIYQKCYNEIAFVIGIISMTAMTQPAINSLVFLTTGENAIPFYIPSKLQSIFIIFWLENTFTTFLNVAIMSAIEAQSLILLGLLNGYSKSLGKRFRKFNIDSIQQIRDTHNEHLKFKKFGEIEYIM